MIILVLIVAPLPLPLLGPKMNLRGQRKAAAALGNNGKGEFVGAGVSAGVTLDLETDCVIISVNPGEATTPSFDVLCPIASETAAVSTTADETISPDASLFV